MPALAYRTTLPRPDDPDLLDTLYQHLADGIPLRYAAVLCGISEHTAYHWVTKAEETLANPDHAGVLGSHALFGQTVKEGRAACVLREMQEWDAADGKLWAKHATKLERLFPQEFGKLRDPGTQLNIGTLNVVSVSADTLDAAHSVLQALAQREAQRLLGPGGQGPDATVIDASSTPQ